jgi:polyhydroxyalkanoate synthesis regulator phasin
MTTSELKRAIDRRFDRSDRRFDRLQRTKVDRTDFRRAITRLRREIAASAAATRRYVDVRADSLERRLRAEIAASGEETRRYVDDVAAEDRRHFQVLAEAIRDDIRVFADAAASHTDRLDQHETRITKLERRSN